MRYESYEIRDYKKEALQDASVPAALKRLAEDVIPNRSLAAFRAMVESGEISPGMASGDQKLMSVEAQILSLPEEEDTSQWFSVLYAGDTKKLLAAQVSSWSGYYNRGYFDLANYDGETLTDYPLLGVLLNIYGDKAVTRLAALSPALLSETLANREGRPLDEPLLHLAFTDNNIKIETLDRLEELAGNADFLKIKNKRGETLFHRIASNSSWTENSERLDLASWMLQRNPKIVNEPDRFGWTPLDRLLSATRGVTDSSLGRLLLASGAKLEKQIAPGFNLAATLQAEEEKRLDKSPVRKLPGPKQGS